MMYVLVCEASIAITLLNRKAAGDREEAVVLLNKSRAEATQMKLPASTALSLSSAARKHDGADSWRLGDSDVLASEKNTVLDFPHNFAPLPLSHRSCRKLLALQCHITPRKAVSAQHTQALLLPEATSRKPERFAPSALHHGRLRNASETSCTGTTHTSLSLSPSDS